jgi:hypothetical protein
MEVKRYTIQDKESWNAFVKSAKNGTFLFDREYMDYHADRFSDHSLMVWNENELMAVFPANAKDKILYSHQGLTYGGIVVNKEIRLKEYLRCAQAILQYAASFFDTIIYKCIPSFYCSFPSEEEKFLFFLLQAEYYRCDTAFVIDNTNVLSVQDRRKRSIKKARQSGLECALSNDWKFYWKKILEPNLQERFGVKPVHALDEIELLKNRFSENIKLFAACQNQQMLAGAVCYIFPNAVHAQYISSSPEGKNLGAIDLLFSDMIEHFRSKKYFSFGIANEKEGRSMNEGLMEWKEGFGARTFIHPFYKIPLENLNLLEQYLKL